MQLSTSEQHFNMASCKEAGPTEADTLRADLAKDQQKVGSAEHSINPLSEAGVLQRILGYVGPGHWLLMALVSKEWRESSSHVPEQQFFEHDLYIQTFDAEFTCVPRMTLLKAAVASAAVIQLACDCGLALDSSKLQLVAGRWGDIATLSAAFECGLPKTGHICDGAARGGCLTELRWLAIEQKCPVYSDISVQAAASGSIPVLNFLKQQGISFTVKTARSAAAAGHRHAIEYLHADGCVFDDTVYLYAALGSHVPVLQSLRELECAWDRAQLCQLAASKGLLHVLQWAKQQGAVFNEGTMVQAAGNGHIAAGEYLHAQQCPFDGKACIAATVQCQLGALQWLLEHDYPHDASILWTSAAKDGYTSVLSLLLQSGVHVSPGVLTLVLFKAGANSQLATAQWLRAQGAEWPGRLSLPAIDGTTELQQWEGAVLAWARAEGCTSPLE
jgi:hypothetical protein